MAMNSLSENNKGNQPSAESSENLPTLADERSSTEPSEINVQSPSALLTIFYGGKLNVYNVSAEKAKAIMVVASRVSGSPSSSASTPSTPSTPSIPSSSPVAAIVSASQAAQRIQSFALPKSPKLSIQRFLEKRNERLHGGKAP